MAAGVAFYSFLALFPAMIAAVLLYGLVRDPAEVEEQTRALTRGLPADAASLLTDQLKTIASTPQQSLGLGLLVTLVLALWSASGGVSNVITSINIAYDEEETRGFVKRKLLALVLTIGAIIFVVITLGLVAAAPALLNDLDGQGPLRWALEAARWIGLVIVMVLGLALLYRMAPDRDAARVHGPSSWAGSTSRLAGRTSTRFRVGGRE
ncbi:YihY/virulence factor BrkB family protein [Nocardioides albidus]|uniref:YihY/virulence factor BrkB family protein n=1 Tax=Nocardioides albidus TaxID=1517589 RepID=A0A5C4VNU4_9ACTN|nr:YihY/virulence factor BrkB family protein [Nocardioides albidus]TNM37497.1 YihY/virulence factor BrkB family protein [Nocardioides albidus]